MLYEIAQTVVTRLRSAGKSLALAESCTGGMVSQYITSVNNSSQVFLGGVVAYSNDIKQSLIQVSSEDLNKFGSVSDQIAVQMAQGVLDATGSDIGASVTGIAGPTGGTPQKPVGTVYIAVATKNEHRSKLLNLHGDRRSIREQSSKQLLNLIKEMIDTV